MINFRLAVQWAPFFGKVIVNRESAASYDGAPTGTRWFVLGLVAFASAAAYLTRYCISAANTTIQADLGFDDARMGELMSAFMLGYLLCQVPGGWLGDRLGTRFAFAFLSVCWSLCNAWSALASASKVFWASRFSLGVFQAGLSPISARVLNDWIPVRGRGFSSACIAAAMSVGGAFTLWLTGKLLALGAGWRPIFAAYSLVGIVWAVVFYWYFRTYPREHRGVNRAELDVILARDQSAAPPAAGQTSAPDDESVEDHSDENLLGTSPLFCERTVPETAGAEAGWSLVLCLLMSPSLWGLCVQAFFRAAGYAFFVTWFFAFLEYVFDIDKAEAGLLNSLPLLAVVAGSLSGGVIVDWLLRHTGSRWISRTGTAFVALAVCGLFTLASAWTKSAVQLSVVTAIGALFAGIGSPAAWAATIDLGGRKTAIVMGSDEYGWLSGGRNPAGCSGQLVRSDSRDQR